MQVRFWGTRGSIAKAGPTTVRYGGNTSCVEVRSASGGILVLDGGTGAHGLGQALVREGEAAARGHVLLSHTHWDHIQGLPFFAPLFVPGNEWHVYGPQGLGPSLGEVLSGQMQYTYFPITPAEYRADVAYHDLVEGSFEVGDIRVTTHYLNHPALTLAYRIEADGATLVYATDHEPHLHRLADGGAPPEGGEDERHGQFLAGADLVIHDAQYTAAEYPARRGWGHSTMEYVVDLARAGAVRSLALFHHDPMRHDDALDALVEEARARARARGDSMEVCAAAEGRTITLRGRAGAAARARAVEEGSALAPSIAGLRGAAVLVACDDPGLAATLAEAAEADGLRPIAAGDTAAAWRALQTERPGLVLAAGDLPGGGGAALCRALRAGKLPQCSDVPVVLVADERSVEPSMGAHDGVTDWLSPPFSTIYARTRIRAWCLRRACRWQPAAVPDDEAARLASLAALGLRAGAEERFDRLTRVAARLLGIRQVMINMVAADHQWTKSYHGMPIGPIPRDMSICAGAILAPDVLQIADTLRSAFADNPILHGDPPFRFYAGMPLRAPDGGRVGTLCLVDPRPRQLDDDELGLLRDLGCMIERELAHPG